MPENTVYVGRPTKYGNPYTVGETRDYFGVPIQVTLENCLELFRAKLKRDKSMGRLNLGPLRGKDLACWCKEDVPCHADVLLEWANWSPAHNLAMGLAEVCEIQRRLNGNE